MTIYEVNIICNNESEEVKVEAKNEREAIMKAQNKHVAVQLEQYKIALAKAEVIIDYLESKIGNDK